MAGGAEDGVFKVGEGVGAEGYRGRDMRMLWWLVWRGWRGGEGWRWDCGGNGVCDEGD